MKPWVRILSVATVCILALIGLVLRESLARASGTEVLLRTDIVDPRDLLTGHYAAINYAEALPDRVECPPSIAQDSNFWQARQSGAREQWISLAPNGEHYSARAMSPTRSDGDLSVLGFASCDPRVPGDPLGPGRPATIRLDLGAARFHAAQADAERITSALNAQRNENAPPVYAIVSIGQDGRARLKGLKIDDERLELNWF